jgi:hypothetical protein
MRNQRTTLCIREHGTAQSKREREREDDVVLPDIAEMDFPDERKEKRTIIGAAFLNAWNC